MKKSLRFICLGFVFAFICAGMSLMHSFPVDTQPFIEKKYSGWNGVLQVWICTKWNPGGSFVQWLNRCASGFEKTHEGVYLEFIPVQQETIQKIHTSGLQLPDIILFSPGIITDSSKLMQLQSSESIRGDLMDYGLGRALPVALGGYIWAYNPSLCDDVPRTADAFCSPALPEDMDGQCYSAALLGLLSGTSDINDVQYSMPDTGIDLGLPAVSSGNSLYLADALDMFIDGELPYLPVDAKTLAYLDHLRESGREPDWKTIASGEIACTDQILMAAIPEHQNADERSELSETFINCLLQQEAQAALADIGAFSINKEYIYSSFSVYTEMETLLNSRPLWLPNCFSEYSPGNAEAIVRRFLSGEISAKNALCLLGFAGV